MCERRGYYIAASSYTLALRGRTTSDAVTMRPYRYPLSVWKRSADTKIHSQLESVSSELNKNIERWKRRRIIAANTGHWKLFTTVWSLNIFRIIFFIYLQASRGGPSYPPLSHAWRYRPRGSANNEPPASVSVKLRPMRIEWVSWRPRVFINVP